MTNNSVIGNALGVTCNYKYEHDHLIGGSRSRKSQEYPNMLVNIILKAYAKSIGCSRQGNLNVQILDTDDIVNTNEHFDLIVYHSDLMNQDLDTNQVNTKDQEFSEIFAEANEDQNPDDGDMPADENMNKDENMPDDENQHDDDEMPDENQRRLPRERPMSMRQLVRRTHCGLRHIGNAKLARIFQGAGARCKAVEFAKTMVCDTCIKHNRVATARSVAPPKELQPNQVVGMDTIYIPGPEPGGKLKMALNLVDWST